MLYGHAFHSVLIPAGLFKIDVLEIRKLVKHIFDGERGSLRDIRHDNVVCAGAGKRFGAYKLEHGIFGGGAYFLDLYAEAVFDRLVALVDLVVEQFGRGFLGDYFIGTVKLEKIAGDKEYNASAVFFVRKPVKKLRFVFGFGLRAAEIQLFIALAGGEGK